jgi:biotin transporter BioY
MVAGHLMVLLLGWLRLGGTLGYGSAFEQGVAPFLVGGAVKSAAGTALAAGVVALGWRAGESTSPNDA